MIRKNNNIKHGNKEQDETNQNCISHFCIFHHNRSYNSTNRSCNSRRNQQCNKEIRFMFHGFQQGFPALKWCEILIRNPRGIESYPQSNDECRYSKPNNNRKSVSKKIHLKLMCNHGNFYINIFWQARNLYRFSRGIAVCIQIRCINIIHHRKIVHVF